VKHDGFGVYCAVRLTASRRERRRERLIRSCARPPFALELIEEMSRVGVSDGATPRHTASARKADVWPAP
jgi:hypothetical protein